MKVRRRWFREGERLCGVRLGRSALARWHWWLLALTVALGAALGGGMAAWWG
jgi:hypothetical protein